MYFENGYVVEDTQRQLVVLLEVKTSNSIGSNFYEVKFSRDKQQDSAILPVTSRPISNPIEYMQEVSKESPLTLNSLISYEKLEDFYNYLEQAGIIRETKESNRPGFEYKKNYSLKSSKYNTQDESIYGRKIK